MKKFNKEEMFGLGVIFLILLSISVPNFIASIRRARDVSRKEDLRSIVAGLDQFAKDFGSFPMSSPDGRIMACIKEGDTVTMDKEGRYVINFIPCDWRKDGLADFTVNDKYYVAKLPQDPQNIDTGASYFYISNGKRYQIYASLEGKREAEYDPKIVARNIHCGTKICNMGRGYSRTPLDISLEAYEELLLKQ